MLKSPPLKRVPDPIQDDVYLRDPTTLTLVCDMTPMRKLSNARVKKQAKVDTKATQRSLQAMPIPT